MNLDALRETCAIRRRALRASVSGRPRPAALGGFEPIRCSQGAAALLVEEIRGGPATWPVTLTFPAIAVALASIHMPGRS
jgi:hypothetical protein